MTPQEYYYPTVDTATRNLFFNGKRGGQEGTRGSRDQPCLVGAGKEDREGVRALFRTSTNYMRRMGSLRRLGEQTIEYPRDRDPGYNDGYYENDQVEIYQDPQPISASTIVYDGEIGASGLLSRNGSRYTARSARSVYSNTTVSSSKSSAGGGGALSQRTVLRSRVNGNSERELERLQEQDRRKGDSGGSSSNGVDKTTGSTNTRSIVGSKRRAESVRARRRKRRMGAKTDDSNGDDNHDLDKSLAKTNAQSFSCSPGTTQFIFNDMQDVYSLMMAEDSVLFD